MRNPSDLKTSACTQTVPSGLTGIQLGSRTFTFCLAKSTNLAISECSVSNDIA